MGDPNGKLRKKRDVLGLGRKMVRMWDSFFTANVK